MLYRVCQRAGIASPKKLIIAAKVLRGYYYLQEPRASLYDVAAKLGYCNARAFADHVTQIFSSPPSSVRKDLEFPQIIAQLKRWLHTDDPILVGVLSAAPTMTAKLADVPFA